jgi:acyl carrier protein
MRPKVHGTWNLHNRLSKSDLDFFLLLSSQVGALGNASQAAYSAANVFLDAFADFRNSQGLPAVALDLGRVVGVGFVAENEGAQRGLNKLWSRDIDPDELKQLVKSTIVNPLRKMGPGSSITGMKPWAPEASPIYLAPFFSHYRRAALKSEKAGGQDGATGGRIREMLKGATSLDEAAKHTCEVVIAKMSNLLMIPFDDISPTKSMADYGMDSLVAVEMRNWLIRELDATMPILELLANVSLLELCKKIVKKSKHSNLAILEEG